jgi:hypothetical protein
MHGKEVTDDFSFKRKKERKKERKKALVELNIN